MSEKWQRYSVMALATVCLVIMNPVLGEWSNDPTARTPVCTADYLQDSPRLIAVEDGFIVSWRDQRRLEYLDIYAQKFSVYGEMLWPENGRVIAEGPAGSLANQTQSNAGLAHDGNGGALIAWNDYYAPYYSYFQAFITRAAPDATVAWGDPGEPIQAPDTAVPMLANPLMGTNQLPIKWDIASDSEGGAFVPVDTWLGRFDSEGRLRTQWFDDPNENQRGDYPLVLVPVVEPGGEDGVIVVWSNSLGYGLSSILASKRVDPETEWPVAPDSFDPVWSTVQLDDPALTGSARLAAVPDGAGGAIAAWMDNRTGNFRVYAQRVDTDGNLAWGPGGVAVSGDLAGSLHWTYNLVMAADEEGGAVIAWNDPWDTKVHTLKAQRLDANGNEQWASGGVVVDTDGVVTYSPQNVTLVRATDGNFILLYSHPLIYQSQELLAQKLAAVDGGLLWGEGSTVFEGCIPNAADDYTEMVSDGRAGAIVAFATCHEQDIYAHRVEGMSEDLVIDFGGIGLWARMNDATWLKLNNASPEQVVVGDMDGNGEDDVIAVFGSGIFVKRNLGPWAQLHNFTPEAMAIGDLDNNSQDDVVIDFGGIGLWARMNDSSWLKLNNASPTQITVGDMDGNGADDVIAVFSSGIFVTRNLGAWAQLHNFIPEALAVGDLDNNGQDDVVIDFGGIALWARMNDSSWLKLHNTSPDLIVTGDIDGNGADDVLATFGSNFVGLWQKQNLGGWSQLNTNAPDEVISGDVDAGQDDIIASFGTTIGGIYVKRNQGAWSKLHNSTPDSMAAGQLDGS